MNEPMRELTLKAEFKNMDFLSREETIACRRHCDCFQRHCDGLAVSIKGVADLESKLGNEKLKSNNEKYSPDTFNLEVPN